MIVLIGAGNMGYAMLAHWCQQDVALVVIEPNPSPQVLALAKVNKFTLNPPAPAATAAVAVEAVAATAVVLAVKPDKARAAIEKNKGWFVEGGLLISIAAGVEVSMLQAASGLEAVVRAMPNTPAQIGKGFIALYASPACSAAQKQLAEKRMAALGEVAFIADENLMDAITVLSGCGPAYLFYLAEVLAQAGTEIGLDKTFATHAIIKTLVGAAHLLEQNPDPQGLRQQVSSAGGVTEAAFDVLLADEVLVKTFRAAFAQALARARALKG